MTDLLQTAATWLEAERHSHGAHDVSYHRGAESVALKASIGLTEFEVETDFGIQKTESRDFLIRTADLVLTGAATEPRRGDRIKETLGEEVVVFEVMAPGQEPPWRFSDPNRLTMRIHTKHVDTEAA